VQMFSRTAKGSRPLGLAAHASYAPPAPALGATFAAAMKL
jgi:hypothetical protein